jgi:hypothetical protein
MPVRKIILHIGMHKTGTTAFQSFCEQNSETLNAAGFLYPHAGRPELASVREGHHLLPWSLTGHAGIPHLWPGWLSDRQDVWSQLTQELEQSGCQTAIISSEEFERFSPSQTAELAEKLRRYEVVVLISLRRFDELVQAMYLTDVVHHAERRRLPEYVSGFPVAFSYSELLEPWRQHFARSPIVHFYTTETYSDSRIVDELATLVGLDVSRADKRARALRINRGRLPWYVIEVCRDMNARDVPPQAVMKFARIMHAIEIYAPVYDMMPPGECQRLIEAGVASLQALQTQRVIDGIPDHFRKLPDRREDERWHSDRGDPNVALSRVLDDIARFAGI